ncbi:MAG TPA: protein kinase [Polyangiaceae bacterium]|nr:protein kinase [Polyangiaceae bacterium]
MQLNTGDLVDGKYRIIRLLGEGGMGAVYEGENTRIHRRVAIKVLHAGVAANGDAVARFEREAQAAGRIGSEHIVEVLDLGQLADGERYMVMEFMDGESLSSRIHQSGRLTAAQVYPIALQMLEGLGAAHSAGIIHRDLKPDNVYLVRNKKGQTDFVKLLDFGISKFNAMGGEFSMTRTGAVMGTPYYMAPEQAKGAKDIDTRVDIYAAGVILYEAVSGQVPFNADTFNELIFKIVLESPPPVEQVAPGLDPGFAAIISKAMARDLNERFASCAEFLAALNAWAQSNPTPVHQAAPAAQVAPVVARAVSAPGAAVDVRTKGAWSNTQGDAAVTPPAPAKKQTGLILAIAAGLLLVLGGGAFTAYKVSSDSKQAALAAAAQAEKDQFEAERKAKEERLRLEEAKQREAAERAAAEARAIAEKSQAEKSEATKAQAEAEGKAAELAKQQASARTVAPVTRPRPTTTSAPKPETTAKPKSGSRQIRTSL